MSGEAPAAGDDEFLSEDGEQGVERINATAAVDTKAVVDGYVSADVSPDDWVKLRVGGDGHGQVNGTLILTASSARHLADQLETAAATIDASTGVDDV